MSTRAVYTFKDRDGAHHVYKHHDGYPSGAAQWIMDALPFAWELPRFEADEFACAFIAAARVSAMESSRKLKFDRACTGGGTRLTKGPKSHGDLEYRYVITCANGELQIQAFSVGTARDANGKPNYGAPQVDSVIFSGSFENFMLFASRADAERF